MRRMVWCGVLTVLLVLAGCGSQPEAAAGAGFGQEDLYLNVAGADFRCYDSIEDVVARLGEGYDYSEAISCAYDGLDKTYTYDLAAFYTYPLSDGDRINEIYTESPEVVTSRGIAVGSSRAEVLAAYGEDCDDRGYALVYELDGERGALCFELDGDEVWAIYLTIELI